MQFMADRVSSLEWGMTERQAKIRHMLVHSSGYWLPTTDYSDCGNST
jgi:hypothetical protein